MNRVATAEALKVITQAIIDEGPMKPDSYGQIWHGCIMRCCRDAMQSDIEFNSLTLEDATRIGNEAATIFMRKMFDVDTSNRG